VCPDGWRARQFLKWPGMKFEEINVEKVSKATRLIMRINGGEAAGSLHLRWGAHFLAVLLLILRC
jgi:glutaredoxin